MSSPRTDSLGWAVEGQRNADLLVRDLRDLRAATDPRDALGRVIDGLDWTLTRADRGELTQVQVRAILHDILVGATAAYDRLAS